MKKILVFLIVMILTSCSTEKTFETPDYKNIDENKQSVDVGYLNSINLFSRGLLEQLYNDEDNMNISPLSIHMILSLLGQGAEGKTKDEINKVLYLNNFTDEEIRSENKKIFENNYIKSQTSKLLLANSIWKDKDYEFMEAFIDISLTDYYSELFEVDFDNQNTNEEINNWVLDHTNNKINPKYKAKPLTVMVLINAVYLMDEWKRPFDEKLTELKNFTLNNGDVIQVDTMQMFLEDYSYLKTEEFTKVPLELKEVGTVEIILPNEGYDLKDLLEASVYNKVLSNEFTGNATVDINLPKTNIESKFLLNDILKSLGMKDAFEYKVADFSKITKSETFVNRVIHQTFFAFDEKEVEAGAVTIVEVVDESAPENLPEEIKFYVDKPFLYTIKSNTGELLFVGVVNNPSLK